MNSVILVVLFCLCFVQSKYSYTDKCYRYQKLDYYHYNFYYQFYVNKKGIPHSRDYIVEELTHSSSKYTLLSFYYHYALTNCHNNEVGYECTSTCESVWFRIDNATSAKEYADHCDPIFLKKFADISKHSCNMTEDPFGYIRRELGRNTTISIPMQRKVPEAPDDYEKSTECVWEWDVIGLWSLISVIVIVVIIIVVLIIFILLLVFTQRHRATKRKRLENSLLRDNPSQSVYPLCFDIID
ncbi:hypothetical protein WA171_001305 [Blastocystis sp. BT1]